MESAELERGLSSIESRSKRELWGCFPYSPVREVTSGAGREFENLISDLDYWQGEIAAYCSYGKGWLQRKNEDIAAALDELSKGFFERFPAYVPLRSEMEASSVVSSSIAVYNEYRLELRGLLGELLIKRVREEKCG